MWAEALAAKLRAAGTDLAALEAERIAALWKAEAPLKALQERAEQLQSRAIAAEKQVHPFRVCSQSFVNSSCSEGWLWCPSCPLLPLPPMTAECMVVLAILIARDLL